MKIAILGYGDQGRAAYDYWHDGNDITICDRNESLDLPADVSKKLGLDYLSGLDDFDLIVRSPSVHPRDIVVANSPEILAKVTTVTNEFMKVCPSKNIIGVTGTKGKGTTSTLITKMLEAAGKRVHLGGNIGTPPLDMLKDSIKPDDWVVLELANFQLIDLKVSPHIAVCLMVVPEHLDWHENIEEYIQAKQQLFVHQQPDDIAVYFAQNDNSKKVVSASNGKKIPYFEKPGAQVMDNQIQIEDRTICRTDELKLLGQHNWENVCAAVTAVWQIIQDQHALRQVLTTFTGLPHRLEFVREIDGIKFYNDSFAATPDAAVAAIEAIAGHKIMIIGGFDRELPLENLAGKISSAAEQLGGVLIIGASAKRLAEKLDEVDFKNYKVVTEKSMAAIVRAAKDLAAKGDSVVLSPGFPSFDMFKNFEDRGNQFKEAVKSL